MKQQTITYEQYQELESIKEFGIVSNKENRNRKEETKEVLDLGIDFY